MDAEPRPGVFILGVLVLFFFFFFSFLCLDTLFLPATFISFLSIPVLFLIKKISHSEVLQHDELAPAPGTVESCHLIPLFCFILVNSCRPFRRVESGRCYRRLTFLPLQPSPPWSGRWSPGWPSPSPEASAVCAGV